MPYAVTDTAVSLRFDSAGVARAGLPYFTVRGLAASGSGSRPGQIKPTFHEDMAVFCCFVVD
jgi:hypothetical protein